MTGRISKDAYGLKLAEAAALRADCTRRQVGAVIIAEDGSIVSTGYNGLASGLPGCASAGACPRGQMAYPSPPPVRVNDRDTTPNEGPYCDAVAPEGPGYSCTLHPDGHEWHIAGTGSLVAAVWRDKPVQPASVGYEATGCRAVHAEVNAILRGRGREGCVGATIYVTDEPCFHCSVVIEGAGIVRVVTPGVGSTVEHTAGFYKGITAEGAPPTAEVPTPPMGPGQYRHVLSPRELADAVTDDVVAQETADVAVTKGGFPRDLYDALVRMDARSKATFSGAGEEPS